MSNGGLDDRMTEAERQIQRHDRTFAQIDEILLAIARRHAETTQILDRVARQQEINTREIAELRALIELQTRNGHGN